MNKKINAIFLGSFLFPHGYAATRRKQQFIDYIIAKGGKARVLLTLKWAKGHEMNESTGIFKEVPYEIIYNVKKNIVFPFTFTYSIIKSFFLLKNYRINNKKNVIVSFGINFNTLFPLLFGRWLGYKIIFDYVEDFETLNVQTSSKKDILKHKISFLLNKLFTNYLASGVSVISNYLMEKHSRRIKDKPIILVPISADNLQIERKNNVTLDKNFTLLYSGTYGQKEGLETLFKAFENFSETHDEAELKMTGNCPKYIKDKIKRLNNKAIKKIILTGRLSEEDYFEELNKASVLMMTRNDSDFAHAGFPYKLGEYLATGNPVIASKVGDVPLYLTDKVSAILFSPENSNDLYSAIRYVYKNRSKADKIGEKGKQICKQNFHPQKNGEKFYKLLLRV